MKKFVAVLLALVMVFGIVPVGAEAVEEYLPPEIEVEVEVETETEYEYYPSEEVEKEYEEKEYEEKEYEEEEYEKEYEEYYYQPEEEAAAEEEAEEAEAAPVIYADFETLTAVTAAAPADWRASMARGLDWLLTTVPAPGFGVVGGEWTILALARGSHTVSVPYGYFDGYVQRIGAHLAGLAEHTDSNHIQPGWVLNPSNGRREVRLANAQSTENARLAVALTALGLDASAFVNPIDGHTYDLVSRFGNRHAYADARMWGEGQGLNGPMWNIIALNSRGWNNPYIPADRRWVGGTTASDPVTAEERVNWLLGREAQIGGWGLGASPDPDMTAMAIQALAPFYGMPGRENVTGAIDRALAWLASRQLPCGGWTAWGPANVQSPAQVIIALTSIGIDPINFTHESGNNPVDAVLSFQDQLTGGFRQGANVNTMATEQAVYALVALDRFTRGMTPLYDMSDLAPVVVPPPAPPAPPVITPPPVTRFALEREILRAERLDAENFTAESWATLETALTEAVSVRGNIFASQPEIDAAHFALTSAINALAPHVPLGRVYISVTDPNHRGAGRARVFFPRTGFELLAGETVYDLLHRTELAVRSRGSDVWTGRYVEAIAGLGEFDEGPYSGWMFRVNGVFPNFSSSLYFMQNGDVVEWLYTRSLGADLGAVFREPPRDPGLHLNPDDVEFVIRAEVAGGTAVIDVPAGAVAQLIAAALGEGLTNIVITAAASEDVSRSEVNLSVASLNAVLEADMTLTVRSDVAAVTLDTATMLGLVYGEDPDLYVTIVSEIVCTAEHKTLAFKVYIGGERVCCFDGEVGVVIPYRSALRLRYRDLLTVYHISGNGTLREMAGAGYDTGEMSFTTTHFSEFAIRERIEQRNWLFRGWGVITEFISRNFSLTISVSAAGLQKEDWETAMDASLDWLQENIQPSPVVGSVGGEWAVLALARAERVSVRDPWVRGWIRAVRRPDNGLRRWTDFQRVSLAVNALGLDATDFNGQDLTEPFQTFVPPAERHAMNQTINADIFALIALGECDYFLESLLYAQNSDGTWNLGNRMNLDLTAMALQALAPFYVRGDERVTDAVHLALAWLRSRTFPDPESTSQMIVALTALGEDASYYVDHLLHWFDPAEGAFRRPRLTDPVNMMATEQAAYALVAHWRFVNGMTALYDFSE